jgi:hypothetical protein
VATGATIPIQKLTRTCTKGNTSEPLTPPNHHTQHFDESESPLISYYSITDVPERLAKIKNFTLFYEDLEKYRLPQWMFITPNMSKESLLIVCPLCLTKCPANNGHDTSTTFGLAWAKDFPTPLLSNPYFMRKTLILLSPSYLYTQND